MSVTFTGISNARARLQRIVDGLRDAAGGGVVARAAAKVQEQIEAVSKAKLSAHQLSGAALGSAEVTASGGLVTLTTLGYPRYHTWWPFRRGGMPPFIVKNASRIFAAELLAAVGGKGSGAAVDAAVEVEEEGAAGDAKKAEAEIKRLDAAIKRREERDEKRADRDHKRALTRADKAAKRPKK